ncbi:malto-oligosyltrehalose synthase [Methylomonas sp. MgM2]
MQNELVPRAVYRLQLNPDFTFNDASDIVPYLQALGISHLYLSPSLKPRAGSGHGYDIVDHNRLNPDLGGGKAFARLVDCLHAHAMGLILDVVPNHMGIGSGENRWWLDVLENGEASTYATYFDIDWHPIRESLRGKVLLPILGDHYGKILEAGELKLEFDEKHGEFSVCYFAWRLPLNPETYPTILTHDVECFAMLANRENHSAIEWHSLLTDFEQLHQLRATPVEKARSAAACKKQLAALYQHSSCVKLYIEQVLVVFNGVPGQCESFDRLHELLELQAYKLSYWRVASDEINYRRFFDINHLLCLRQQNPEVFEASHRLIFALIADGSVDGLRIDHIDGLWDPGGYCRRLQQEAGRIKPRALNQKNAEPERPLYLLAEKILAGYEHLREDWPIAGTTGYEFANSVNGLLVDSGAERELTRIYARFIGRKLDFNEVLYECKRQVVRNQLSSHLTTLVNLLAAIAEFNRSTRDYTLNGLREALTEVVAFFPVYRTYINIGNIKDEDRRFVDWAIAQAKKRSPAADITIFDFIHDVMLFQNSESHGAEYVGQIRQFVMKFQQYTAPVMAKGMEDTSFYVYNRLVSLNDVGGDPRRFGTSIAAFHHANQQRLKQWPDSLITLATHDSKRSGDVRARIDTLSEFASDWRQALSRWRRLNRGKKRRVNGQLAPSRNAEYLLYQTLLGAWPLENMTDDARQTFAERIETYMLKAVREAKVNTSWINPNQDYEEAVSGFVISALNPKQSGAFYEDFLMFQRRISLFGFYNSLAQTLLLLTSPGVPDLYQGTELWQYTLVDPDSRQPVDFALRQRGLKNFLEAQHSITPSGKLRNMLNHIESGQAKLFVIWKTLNFRKAYPELFSRGDYQALETEGQKAEHVCAFVRRKNDHLALTVVGRCYAQLEPGSNPHTFNWEDTRIILPDTLKQVSFRNVFSGAVLQIKPQDGLPCLTAEELFKVLPIALLVADGMKCG